MKSVDKNRNQISKVTDCSYRAFIFIILFSLQTLNPLYAKPNQVLIPGTCFEMGSDVYIIEEPIHQVCLDAFLIDSTEVSQKNFEETTGSNPSKVKGPDLPVSNVSWHEAELFCRQRGGRLPTEAEWEYAAGQGKESLYSWGYDMEEDRAWFAGNSKGQPHPVGQTHANSLGVYDLNGNVWEWVGDWFSPAYYEESPKQNPTGPANGEYRLIRGGSYNDPDTLLRTAYRYWYPPQWRSADIGFRCATSPEKAERKGMLQ